MGPATVWRQRPVQVDWRRVPEGDAQAEARRLEAALTATRDELLELQGQLVSVPRASAEDREDQVLVAVPGQVLRLYPVPLLHGHPVDISPVYISDIYISNIYIIIAERLPVKGGHEKRARK